MGNNGSQNTTITEPHALDKWLHPYPKPQHQHSKQNYQHKVLPERDAHLKLRPTGNGEIIQSGGTISGRQFRLTQELKEALHKNLTKNYEECSSKEEKEFFREKDNPRKITFHGVKQKLSNNLSSQQKKNTTKNNEECSSNDGKEFSRENDSSRKVFLQKVKQKISNVSSHQIKYFASEPDLRYACRNVNNDFQDRGLRKKYKAPSPPKRAQESDQLQTTKQDLLNPGLPIRKARLFKTRAETKKQSSHLNETTDDYVNNNTSNNNKVTDKMKTLNLSDPKLNSNDFVRELKDATRKLRHVEPEKEESNYTRTKLNTLDPNVSVTKDLTKKLLLTIENNSHSKNSIPQCSRGEASGKESTTPDMSPSPTSRSLATRDRAKQHFYFGMNNNITKEKQLSNGVYTNFATKSGEENSSESDLSSDIESDENDTYRTGIDLQLRPILPKKQLEIPRFSPSAAWRLLSMNNDNTTGTMISDDVPVLLEDHIEKFSRPPPPLVNVGQRSSNDKSGDSGISGDGPDAVIPISYCYDDVTSANDINNRAMRINKIPMKYLNKPETPSWTPQQDLEDDTSTEEDVVNEKTLLQKSRAHLGPHKFSLSLPRDNHLAAYMIEKNYIPQYSGLQKFKRSLSGVLGRKDTPDSNCLDENSANWFLSKSAPNSLTHTFHSLERHRMQDAEELLYPSNVNASSRLIYLPEIDLEKNKLRNFKSKFSTYSKSCDDISLVETYRPEPLQDPISNDDYSEKLKKKAKKYTFQSTIRQIEKKRLSDKLSREAEKRERKRLRELEAMQKVEEEFQKKRAREKANLRNQLRLFSLDENAGWHSLPPNFEIDHKEGRSEPDGALSSVSSSSSSIKNNSRTYEFEHSKISKFENKSTSAYTKELSEYRQPQRNYKDYNSNIKYTTDKGYNRQTTVHPKVSYNMPKAKGSKTKEGHNYRKEFATGIRVLSTASSHSEDSQNYSTKRNKLTGSRRSYNMHLISS